MTIIECPNCGKLISERSGNCRYCGNSITPAGKTEYVRSTEQYYVVVTGFEGGRKHEALMGLKRFSLADDNVLLFYMNNLPFIFAHAGSDLKCLNMQNCLQLYGVQTEIIKEQDTYNLIPFPKDLTFF